MIIDKKMEFSNKQAVSANALSENVVAIAGSASSPNATVDLGAGEPLWLMVKLAAGAVSGTGTLAVSLESADNSAMTGAKVMCSSGDVDVSKLKSGELLYAVQLPLGQYQRYLAVRYKVTGTLTGAKVNAFMTKDVDVQRSYASGSQIA